MSAPRPDAEVPRAVVWLRLGGGERIRLMVVDGAKRCDLALVEDLLRMRLGATRAGWRVEITDVCGELAELFEMVGLTDQLGPTP